MDTNQRSRLGLGLLLILAGIFITAYQFIPGFKALFDFQYSWPISIIAVGAALLAIGLLSGAPDMAVPACIVAGTGAILYWQNLTGDFASWAYAWTLYPGFAGLGVIIASLFKPGSRKKALEGLNSLFVSAVLFLVAASLFGPLKLFGPYWPLLLILFGLYLIIRSLFKPKS